MKTSQRAQLDNNKSLSWVTILTPSTSNSPAVYGKPGTARVEVFFFSLIAGESSPLSGYSETAKRLRRDQTGVKENERLVFARGPPK